MEEKPKKKPAPKKKFKKNYFLVGFGPVGKGTEVRPEHKKSTSYSDALTE